MIPRDPAIPRDLVEKSRNPAGLKKRGIWSTVLPKPMPNIPIPMGYAIDELCLAFEDTLQKLEVYAS